MFATMETIQFSSVSYLLMIALPKKKNQDKSISTHTANKQVNKTKNTKSDFWQQHSLGQFQTTDLCFK